MTCNSLLRRFRRQDEGVVTVEFCLLFPAFMYLMLVGIEAGVLMTRQLMLERGLDLTMRELRIGSMADPTAEKVRAEVCDKALVIPDCHRSLALEMNEVDTAAWNVPLEGNRCTDRTADIDPANDPTFNTGERNVLMMVRACAVFTPLFPGAGLAAQIPLDASGGYHLLATSGFVNEP